MNTSSDRGIDYSGLEQLLQDKRWYAAEWETASLILQVIGRDSWKPVQPQWLLHFPSRDLKTIDQLWIKASQERYGFSVQKRIWKENGSPISDNDDWRGFCEKIAWPIDEIWADEVRKKIKWDGTGPIGHLPTWGVPGGLACWRGAGIILSLLSHADL